MLSLWKRHSLFAVALATGGSGAFLELQAPSGAPAPTPTVSRAILVDGASFAQIRENGDGTALVDVFSFLSPTTILGRVEFASTDYTISANWGQSGQQSGTGTGEFTMQGAFAFDILTFSFVGPFDVNVNLGVANATEIDAFVSQGIKAQHDPLTGQTQIVREHVMGNQASGDTAGTLSIHVDAGSGFNLVANETGVLGIVTLNRTHEHERIR